MDFEELGAWRSPACEFPSGDRRRRSLSSPAAGVRRPEHPPAGDSEGLPFGEA